MGKSIYKIINEAEERADGQKKMHTLIKKILNNFIVEDTKRMLEADLVEGSSIFEIKDGKVTTSMDMYDNKLLFLKEVNNKISNDILDESILELAELAGRTTLLDKDSKLSYFISNCIEVDILEEFVEAFENHEGEAVGILGTAFKIKDSLKLGLFWDIKMLLDQRTNIKSLTAALIITSETLWEQIIEKKDIEKRASEVIDENQSLKERLIRQNISVKNLTNELSKKNRENVAPNGTATIKILQDRVSALESSNRKLTRENKKLSYK